MANTRQARKQSRRNDGKIIALFLVGAGLLVFGIVGLIMLPSPASSAEELPSAVPVEVSFPAPELSLNSLDGSAVTLSDLRGQTVLVNNWATWCPPCKAEMPDLNRYYNKHKNENFILIGIEAGDTPQNISKIVSQFNLDYPIWADPGEHSMQAFQTSYLPSSFLIDPEGNVRLAWSGAISLKNLEKYVTPLLED